MVCCAVWYRGEETPSFLEDFFSPDHCSTAVLAKRRGLKHENGIEEGQKARPKLPQLVLLPETKGKTHLVLSGVVLESRAGTPGMGQGQETSMAWAAIRPPHSQASALSFVRGRSQGRHLGLRAAPSLPCQGGGLTETFRNVWKNPA